ncbi:hypothetical protein [Wolbachia endosymbiont of Dactylopius coccus]
MAVIKQTLLYPSVKVRFLFEYTTKIENTYLFSMYDFVPVILAPLSVILALLSCHPSA